MKNKISIKDSSLAFILSFIIGQLAVAFVSMLLMTIIKGSSFGENSAEVFLSTSFGYMILSLSLYAALLCIFIFLNKGKDNKLFAKPKTTKTLFYILVAIASFLCLYPIVTCFDSLLVKLGVKINTLDYPLTTKNYFISIISLVIAPAIVEELIFRGIIYKGLSRHGKTFGIILSAVMFSIFHMAASQTIYPLLMGVLFAVIMLYENNIYYCMVAHLTNNFMALTLSYFNVNLMFNGISYIILAIILAIVFITTLTFIIIKKRNTENTIKLTKKDLILLICSLVIMMVFWIALNLA